MSLSDEEGTVVFADDLQESALRTLSLEPVWEEQGEDEAVEHVCL